MLYNIFGGIGSFKIEYTSFFTKKSKKNPIYIIYTHTHTHWATDEAQEKKSKKFYKRQIISSTDQETKQFMKGVPSIC